MSEFGDQVEYAARPGHAPKAWRLMAFNVPERHVSLMTRHLFRPTKKNPAHWWRLFDPARRGDRDIAAAVLADFRTAAISSKWSEVDPLPRRKPKKRRGKGTEPGRDGFGGKLNARPNSFAWRR